MTALQLQRVKCVEFQKLGVFFEAFFRNAVILCAQKRAAVATRLLDSIDLKSTDDAQREKDLATVKKVWL